MWGSDEVKQKKNLYHKCQIQRKKLHGIRTANINNCEEDEDKHTYAW